MTDSTPGVWINLRYFEDGRLVLKDVQLPGIPRRGELVCIGGWSHKREVTEVVYDPERSLPTVCLREYDMPYEDLVKRSE